MIGTNEIGEREEDIDEADTAEDSPAFLKIDRNRSRGHGFSWRAEFEI
jgi:hypothetical protein